MNRKYTLKLNLEQFKRLERLLDYEIEQEYYYAVNGSLESEYITELVDLYEAIHLGNADGFFEALVYEDDIKAKRALIQEIEDLKARL